MKIGIKKNHENDWQVHVGNATICMDRFSVELLSISLEHLLALEHGETHSVLTSYVRLGTKMLKLNGESLQLLVRSVDNKDLLILILVAENDKLASAILDNVGGILAKQLRADIEKSQIPDVDEAKAAIRRIVETMFNLEAEGKIEFYGADTQFI